MFSHVRLWDSWSAAEAPEDADQARLVRLVRKGLFLGAKLVQQAGELVGDEPLVDDAVDGRALLGARRSPVRRQHRFLVPREERTRPLEVADLARDDAQPL